MGFFNSKKKQNEDETYHDLGVKLFKEEKYKEAFIMFQMAADEFEHSEARYRIASMYKDGIGTKVNLEQALVYFERAANQGHKKAGYTVGCMYEEGEGTKVDYIEAMRRYRNLALQNHGTAQYKLGLMYQKGLGVPIDLRKAFEWFEQAAALDYEHSSMVSYTLGCAYKNGLGVEKDMKKALYYFESAANHGLELAQFQLGLLLSNGFGVEEDIPMAFVWLDKSKGHPASRLCLGSLYEKGRLVGQDRDRADYYYNSCEDQDAAMVDLGMTYLKMRGEEKCAEQALFWFKKAAKKDNVHALIALGSMYLMGAFDHKVDIDTAYNYLSKAAKLEQVSLDLDQLKSAQDLEPGKKYSNSMKWYYAKDLKGGKDVKRRCVSGLSCIGFMYHKGLGVRQDFAKAHAIYLSVLQEVDDEDTDANMCLGLLYLKGLGVKQDYQRAREYFKRSAQTINSYTYNLIGDTHRLGKGVIINDTPAMEWYEKGSRYSDAYSDLNIGKLKLYDQRSQILALNNALGYFQTSYHHGCQEASEFIQRILDIAPSAEKLLEVERLAREAAEEKVRQLSVELARVDPKNKVLSDIVALDPTLLALKVSSLATLEKKRESLQFFHLDNTKYKANSSDSSNQF